MFSMPINYAQIYADLIGTVKPIIIIFIINYDRTCKNSHVNANYTTLSSKYVSIPFLQIPEECPLNSTLGHTKLMLCFMGYLPSQGDPVGRKNKNRSTSENDLHH